MPNSVPFRCRHEFNFCSRCLINFHELEPPENCFSSSRAFLCSVSFVFSVKFLFSRDTLSQVHYFILFVLYPTQHNFLHSRVPVKKRDRKGSSNRLSSHWFRVHSTKTNSHPSHRRCSVVLDRSRTLFSLIAEVSFFAITTESNQRKSSAREHKSITSPLRKFPLRFELTLIPVIGMWRTEKILACQAFRVIKAFSYTKWKCLTVSIVRKIILQWTVHFKKICQRFGYFPDCTLL